MGKFDMPRPNGADYYFTSLGEPGLSFRLYDWLRDMEAFELQEKWNATFGAKENGNEQRDTHGEKGRDGAGAD